MDDFPERIADEKQLEELLSRPGDELVKMFSQLDGDLLFLGVTGKIGPSLARMASRAIKKAGIKKNILGVARNINGNLKNDLNDNGIVTMQGDLLDRDFLNKLPQYRNVIFLAGMKFGAAENLPLTWALNSYLPALVADQFRNSRIIAFSTGCVYPLVTVASGGSVESDQPVATGEYAQSCLGRERMFGYGSVTFGTPVIIIRLNYAVEMRYGVIVDIALKVRNKQPVDLGMGYFNVMWQGDVNDFVLRSLEQTKSPANILNLTGPGILSVRKVANEFGKLFGTSPVFTGIESETALLNNASRAFALFGNPGVPVEKVILWTADWIDHGGKLLNRPTHFEVRDGIF